MKDQLSKDSQRRLEENPLRVLDSKEKEDKAAVEQAPSILDYLDEESQAHFDAVRRMLEDLGVAYVIDTNMVRGLDYYNHTIFEFITEIEGNELTVCAGGRYDGLLNTSAALRQLVLDLVSVWNGSFSFLKRKALNYRSKQV